MKNYRAKQSSQIGNLLGIVSFSRDWEGSTLFMVAGADVGADGGGGWNVKAREIRLEKKQKF